MTFLIPILIDLVLDDRRLCFCILHCLNHLIEYVRFVCQRSAQLGLGLTFGIRICSHNPPFFWQCMLHNYL